MNFCIAVGTTILVKILFVILPSSILQSTVGGVLIELLQYMIYINYILMVFNLMPIPPLDGFNLITQIFNLQQYDWYYRFYNMGGMILLLVIFLGGTSFILGPIVSGLYNMSMHFIMM